MLKKIIETLFTILMWFFIIYSISAVILSILQIKIANEVKSNYISEIEDSDFNTSVINSCKENATDNDYKLTVDAVEFDSNNNTNLAKVSLTYKIKVPLFSVSIEKTTEGIAR